MTKLNCPVCHSSNVTTVFHAMVLNKHSAEFCRCAECKYLYTPSPYWLDEAYSADQAVVDSDTGLLKRNLVITQQLSVLLHFGLRVSRTLACLDVAGGYGVLTRLMRDAGFNFYWGDPYCSNVLAKGFSKLDNTDYPIVTAFEVLEHVQNPVQFVEDLFSSTNADTFVFSTQLYEGDIPAQDWWYYCFATGQHISFYHHSTLQAIAKRLGLYFVTHAGLHAFSKKPLPQLWLYKLLVGRHWLRSILAYLVRKHRISYTTQDHLTMLKGRH